MAANQTTINIKPDRKDVVLENAEAYAHAIYQLSRNFPKSALFGITSQIRRASLSVALNIVEGYARQSKKSEVQFLKIAYGSLKESQFILKFAKDEGLLDDSELHEIYSLGDDTAKLIWKKTKTLESTTL